MKKLDIHDDSSSECSDICNGLASADAPIILHASDVHRLSSSFLFPIHVFSFVAVFVDLFITFILVLWVNVVVHAQNELDIISSSS